MKGFLEDGSFAGKTALVTGGGTGLGLAISRLLAGLGASVVIASRSADHHGAFLAEAEENGWSAAAHCFDVREPEQVAQVCQAVADQFGSLDILVNNAAGNFIRPSLDLPPKGWQAVIDIALSGVFYCSQAAGRIMAGGAGGAIVNIIAPYAETGAPGVVHSVSAKAGVLAMTKTLAVEWAGQGIRVNAVSPGPFESEGAAERLWPIPGMKEAIEKQIPLGRFAGLDEVARQVVLLASDQASYVSGACLTVDAAWSLGKGILGEMDPEVIKRFRG